ncbi:MAG: SMI1/KNR4 family protein [Lysobacterales bacterium]
MAHLLKTRLERMLGGLERQGYDVRELVFEPVAGEHEVLAVEQQLGIALPVSFRNVLQKISRNVDFGWFSPRGLKYPRPFQSNFCGGIHWSVDTVAGINSEKDSWVREVFPEPNDAYDRVWHQKLAFLEVGNGDYLALDLHPESIGKVVYLSHDDGAGHGHALAADFEDLLERWVPLACTGAEDWQWMPFTSELTTYIDPTTDLAREWRLLLGAEA